MMKRILLAIVVAHALATGKASAQDAFPRVPATEPRDAEKTFRTLAGFRMELIAAEPLVTDPVAMTYDEDGRAYVVEMNDYPYTDKKTHQPWKENVTDAPTGKVRLLVDEDGDGKFDRSTVFAEGLSWPTGVACWKGGVFVTATPDVWYLKDTDGDSRADVKSKVFTGFRKYNVQAVINNLAWGLDNKLYAAGATNGANVVRVKEPEAKPVPMLRNDFRFDPETEDFELLSGGARFGNAFDDWGNRFLCNIRNPAQHVVIEYKYLKRNPYLAVGGALQDVAESGDALPVYRLSAPEAWREARATRWAGDRTVVTPRSELVAGGVVTSASGITVYRGSAYPEEYRGQIFVGEVANNLVHRQVPSRNGASFTSKRVDEKSEFVCSTDVWFRPVNFVNAPDGTLHVLDMYREVIEHPWSIPDDIHEKLDLRSGSDRGRIYRLAPEGFTVPAPTRLGKATGEELVKLLGHPNAWQRETAQRLLVERQERSAVESLREMLKRGDSALGRLHALWTLHGLAAVEEGDLLAASSDASAGVRENALRVAESRMAGSMKLRERLFAMADDEDARVRFQAALSAGEVEDERLAGMLAKVLKKDAGDLWAVTAALTSAVNNGGDVLALLVMDGEFVARAEGKPVLKRVAALAGARNQPKELERSIAAMEGAGAARAEMLAGLGEGLRRSRRTLRDVGTFPWVVEELERAARVAMDASASLETRVAAIRLLACDRFDVTAPVLGKLLGPREGQEVQRAADAAAGASTDARVAPLLLEGWKHYTPAVRGDVISTLLAQKNRLMPLLDAVEKGKVPAAQIPAARRTLLVQHADAEIRDKAMTLFESISEGDARKARVEAIERYRPALSLVGDVEAGRKVFEATCANCHKVGAVGNDVGPNLATVRSWTKEQLLANIVDPNREVAPAFVEYVIELENGENLSGVVADETAGALTVVMAGGVKQTVLRQGIRKMFSSGMSLMPESLEAGMSLQQVADLIEFIRKP